MKKYILFCVVLVNSILCLYSQGLRLPINNMGTDQMGKWDIIHPEKFSDITSSFMPYTRQEYIQIAHKIYHLDSSSFLQDINTKYFLDDNWWIINNEHSQIPISLKSQLPIKKKGVLGLFYKHNKSFVSLGLGEESFIEINPLIGLSYGRSDSGDPIYGNTRGLSISGNLDNRFYFHSEIREIQRQLPTYADEFRKRYKVVPHAANYKTYESPLLNVKDGLDYNYSNGYLGFKLSKHFSASIGHGKHFIGNGMRSLLLSDFGMNYFYTQLKWNFGKLQYHNLYTVLKSRSKNDTPRDGLIPKKYMSAHYLNIKFLPSLEFGIYESVVFSRNNGYELEYLNPIIFYRSVESGLGSPDNVLLGMNVKWNLKKHWSFYGQVVIDEFKLNEIIDYKKGWWGNKWGLQLGMKYINMFNISNLDLQIEYNIVRPYVYSHRDSVRSYAHYNQSLAHPWGANFKELIVSLKYQPTSKLHLEAYWINGCRGLDLKDENNGSDILRSYYEGVNFYGNEICQGNRTDVNLLSFMASYQFYHNYNVDIQYLYRGNKSIDKYTYQMWQLGFRINLEKYDLLF